MAFPYTLVLQILEIWRVEQTFYNELLFHSQINTRDLSGRFDPLPFKLQSQIFCTQN